MTNPICPECLRLGTGHSDFQRHTVVITQDGECPLCGFCVSPDIVWCRVCEAAVATEPGQLCAGCAAATGTFEITLTEARRFHLPPTPEILGLQEDPEGAIEDAELDFYGW